MFLILSWRLSSASSSVVALSVATVSSVSTARMGNMEEESRERESMVVRKIFNFFILVNVSSSIDKIKDNFFLIVLIIGGGDGDLVVTTNKIDFLREVTLFVCLDNGFIFF